MVHQLLFMIPCLIIDKSQQDFVGRPFPFVNSLTHPMNCTLFFLQLTIYPSYLGSFPLQRRKLKEKSRHTGIFFYLLFTCILISPLYHFTRIYVYTQLFCWLRYPYLSMIVEQNSVDGIHLPFHFYSFDL